MSLFFIQENYLFIFSPCTSNVWSDCLCIGRFKIFNYQWMSFLTRVGMQTINLCIVIKVYLTDKSTMIIVIFITRESITTCV